MALILYINNGITLPELCAKNNKFWKKSDITFKKAHTGSN